MLVSDISEYNRYIENNLHRLENDICVVQCRNVFIDITNTDRNLCDIHIYNKMKGTSISFILPHYEARTLFKILNLEYVTED